MNGSCEKLGAAPLRSVHELRGLILSGGPAGQVASPTTRLESGEASKTPEARCPVVGGRPLAAQPGRGEPWRELTLGPRGAILRSAE